MNLADRRELIAHDLGDGNRLDLAGGGVAEAGNDELADGAAFRLEPVAARPRAIPPGAALGDDPLGADLADGIE